MKEVYKVLSLLFLFAIVGCSAPSGETQSSFQIGIRDFASQTGEFPGGLMLFGKSGDRSFGRVLTQDIQDELIPNGVWDFYVIGWNASDSGPQMMSGKVFCAVQRKVELIGEPTIINLNASNADCARPVFGHTYTVSGEVRFADINIHTCKDITDPASSCAYNYDLSADPVVYTNNKGTALSYRIIAQSFNKAGANLSVVGTNSIKSGCAKAKDVLNDVGLDPVDDRDFISQGLNIPQGTLNSPFAMLLRAYTGSDNCVDSYGKVDVPMLNGASPNNPRAKTILSSNLSTIKVKTTAEDVCRRAPGSGVSYSIGGTQESAPFRGGKGTAGAPFIICDGGDLNEIGTRDGAYLLGKDIDMSPYTVALDPTDPAPGAEGPGDNFSPIGIDYSSIPTVATWTGVFDGGGHKILNLRKRDEDQNHLGFISDLQGKLMNVQFENIELEGKSFVGLVGYGSNSQIYNVSIKRGRFEARGESAMNDSYLGSIAGHWNSGKIEKALVQGARLRSQLGEYVGGLVGALQSSWLKRSSFNGSINADNNSASYLGGAVGKAWGSGTPSDNGLVSVSTRGLLHVRGTDVGGLAGHIANSSVTSSYSNMLVSTIENEPVVGGLIGGVTSGDLASSYFSGQVMAPNCPSNCAGDRTLSHGSANINNSAYLDKSFFGSATNLGVAESGLTNVTGLLGTPAPFVNTPGVYPYLEFESGLKCANSEGGKTYSEQVGLGRGSALRPVLVCSQSQLNQALSSGGAGMHYVLGESLNVGAVGTPMNFNGHLNGLKNTLMGVVFSSDIGIIDTLTSTSTVSHLNIMGAGGSTCAAIPCGVLAKQNDGIINDIKIMASLNNVSDSSLLVGLNSENAQILRSHVAGTIGGSSSIGAIASENNGTIKYSRADFDFISLSGSQYIGGLVGNNGGVIEESSIRAKLNTKGAGNGLNALGEVGLIAGLNQSGASIKNCLVENGEILLNSTGVDSQSVGGMAGRNAGRLEKNLSFGVIRASGSGGNSIGGLAGKMDGTGSAADNFFAFNPVKEIEVLNFGGSDTVSCSATQATFGFSPSLTIAADIASGYLIYSEREFGVVTSTISNGTYLLGTPLVIDVDYCADDSDYALYEELGAFNTDFLPSSYLDLVDEQFYIDEGWGIGLMSDDDQGYYGHNEQDLIDFHMARTQNPEVEPPFAWEMELGKPPRLIGIND